MINYFNGKNNISCHKGIIAVKQEFLIFSDVLKKQQDNYVQGCFNCNIMNYVGNKFSIISMFD